MSARNSEDQNRAHVATLRRHLADKPLLSPRLRDAIEALERSVRTDN